MNGRINKATHYRKTCLKNLVKFYKFFIFVRVLISPNLIYTAGYFACAFKFFETNLSQMFFITRDRSRVNIIGRGGLMFSITRGPTMVGTEGKKIFKNEALDRRKMHDRE